MLVAPTGIEPKFFQLYFPFEELLEKDYPLLSTQERKPENFIRHIYRRSPDVTLFEEYLYRMLKIAYEIAR